MPPFQLRWTVLGECEPFLKLLAFLLRRRERFHGPSVVSWLVSFFIKLNVGVKLGGNGSHSCSLFRYRVVVTPARKSRNEETNGINLSLCQGTAKSLSIYRESVISSKPDER